MKANTKAIHYVTKSNAFRSVCGQDFPERETMKPSKVTCKTCKRVLDLKRKPTRG